MNGQDLRTLKVNSLTLTGLAKFIKSKPKHRKSISGLIVIGLLLPVSATQSYAVEIDTCIENAMSGREYMNLAGCNLSGVDLSGKNLIGAHLKGANLAGANLNGTRLWWVNCENCILDNADLRNADVSGMRLQGASLTNVDGRGLRLTQGTIPLLPAGWAILGGAFHTRHLVGPEAILRDTRFERTGFEGVSLINADLTNVWASRIEVAPKDLPPGWAVRGGILVGPKANLSEMNLEGLDLDGVDLSNANLTNLQSSGLKGSPLLPGGWRIVGGHLFGPNVKFSFGSVVFEGLDLQNIDLSAADLSEVAFQNCNLSYADLSNANLSGVDFGNVNFIGANFSNSNLAGASGYGIIGQPTLPQGFKVSQGHLLGPTSIVQSASFRFLDLKGINLEGAQVYDTDFTGSDLTGSNLQNVIVGRSDFSQVNFTSVNMHKANLEDVRLDGVKSSSVVGSPVLPSGWKLERGYLLGKTANFQSANLSNQNLSFLGLSGMTFQESNLSGALLRGTNFAGSDLRDANLEGANLESAVLNNTDLSGTKLNGVRSGKVLGSPILPKGWKLAQGYLVGPSSFLQNANLSAVNLPDVDLSYSDLSFANLAGANLARANFTGAVLDGVDLTRSQLQAVRSGGIRAAPSWGAPKLPKDWVLRGGYLLGPTANLQDSPMNKLNLDGINLGSSNLKNVQSSALTGRPKLPKNWVLVKGMLIGPGANLSNKNLSKLDLSKASISGANISNAQLIGAKFRIQDNGVTVIGKPKNLPSGWKVINGKLRKSS
jgi:uncharacterized protein YjbI with pentapeptide repeats